MYCRCIPASLWLGRPSFEGIDWFYVLGVSRSIHAKATWPCMHEDSVPPHAALTQKDDDFAHTHVVVVSLPRTHTARQECHDFFAATFFTLPSFREAVGRNMIHVSCSRSRTRWWFVCNCHCGSRCRSAQRGGVSFARPQHLERTLRDSELITFVRLSMRFEDYYKKGLVGLCK
jgi:hypothetical protein